MNVIDFWAILERRLINEISFGESRSKPELVEVYFENTRILSKSDRQLLELRSAIMAIFGDKKILFRNVYSQ